MSSTWCSAYVMLCSMHIGHVTYVFFCSCTNYTWLKCSFTKYTWVMLQMWNCVHVILCLLCTGGIVFKLHKSCRPRDILHMWRRGLMTHEPCCTRGIAFKYKLHMSHVAYVKLCPRDFVFTLHSWYCVQITQVMSSTWYSAYVMLWTHEPWAMLHMWYCIHVRTTHESYCICDILINTQVMSSTWYSAYVMLWTHESWVMLQMWYCVQVSHVMSSTSCSVQQTCRTCHFFPNMMYTNIFVQTYV